MKKAILALSILLLLCITFGCVKQTQVKSSTDTTKAAAKTSKAPAKQTTGTKIAVLTQGKLSGLTPDQKRELDVVMNWMDRDIIKQFKRVGYTAVLIKSKKEYKKSMGPLLIIDVDNFNPGSRAARAFVGYGAGAASLDLKYTLLKSNGGVQDKWKDGAGSSRGGTYCAQTLNRKAVKRVTGKGR